MGWELRHDAYYHRRAVVRAIISGRGSKVLNPFWKTSATFGLELPATQCVESTIFGYDLGWEPTYLGRS
jgi:hypothetical protein